MLNKLMALVSVGLFLALTSWCSEKKELPTPESLLSRARSQQDIWSDGTSPLILREEVRLFDLKGSPVVGDYILYWASPSRWREEIRFGDYERIRVGTAKGYWQKSTLDYQPHVILHLDVLLHLKGMFRVGPKETLGKVKRNKKAGTEQMCTEIKWTQGTARIMCFDASTGVLPSVEYPKLENQHPLEISRIEYSSFAAFGNRLVPREIRALKGREAVAAVKVLEIAKLSEDNPALFSAPANAEFWAQCEDMREPELLERVPPRYPPMASANREQGLISLYAVIEADGSLSHLTVTKSAAPNLDAAVVEAVRRWRYKPASCEGTPIPFQTSVEIDFSLQY